MGGRRACLSPSRFLFTTASFTCRVHSRVSSLRPARTPIADRDCGTRGTQETDDRLRAAFVNVRVRHLLGSFKDTLARTEYFETRGLHVDVLVAQAQSDATPAARLQEMELSPCRAPSSSRCIPSPDRRSTGIAVCSALLEAKT